MIKSINELIQKAKKSEGLKIAVACAHDKEVLLSLSKAVKEKIVKPILIGKKDEIKSLINQLNLEHFEADIIDSHSDNESAEIAVKNVSEGKAQMLMKGLISTSTFLKALLYSYLVRLS